MSKAELLLEKLKGVKETKLLDKSLGSIPTIEPGNPLKPRLIVTMSDYTKFLADVKARSEMGEDDVFVMVVDGGDGNWRGKDPKNKGIDPEDVLDEPGVKIMVEKITKSLVPLIKRHKETDAIYFDRYFFYTIGEFLYPMVRDIATQVGGRAEELYKTPYIFMPSSPSFKPSMPPEKKRSIIRRVMDRILKPKKAF
jgi:hypothetical protein